MSRAQYHEELLRCAGLKFSQTTPVAPRTQQLRAALARFARCLRSHGVNVPEPNTSGTGPLFPRSSVNPASPQYRAAAQACLSTLHGGIPTHPIVKKRG
jgi:hypothetical protein